MYKIKIKIHQIDSFIITDTHGLLRTKETKVGYAIKRILLKVKFIIKGVKI